MQFPAASPLLTSSTWPSSERPGINVLSVRISVSTLRIPGEEDEEEGDGSAGEDEDGDEGEASVLLRLASSGAKEGEAATAESRTRLRLSADERRVSPIMILFSLMWRRSCSLLWKSLRVDVTGISPLRSHVND